MPESIDAILKISKEDRILYFNRKYLKNIPEKKHKLRVTLRKIETHLDQLKEREEKIVGRIQERETLINVENGKIDRSNERMLSVKNQKEYLAIQKEIDVAKKTVKHIEDQILDLEEAKEGVAKELADILAEYNQEKESVLEEEQEVLAEEKTILEKIDTCNKLKAEVSSKVDPGMMEEYEALVKRNLIPAAVAIGTSSCLGCAMAIPAQVFNDIIRDLSGKCPHCGRLLFYKELEKPEKEKKEKKKRATKKKPTKKKVTTKAEG